VFASSWQRQSETEDRRKGRKEGTTIHTLNNPIHRNPRIQPQNRDCCYCCCPCCCCPCWPIIPANGPDVPNCIPPNGCCCPCACCPVWKIEGIAGTGGVPLAPNAGELVAIDALNGFAAPPPVSWGLSPTPSVEVPPGPPVCCGLNDGVVDPTKGPVAPVAWADRDMPKLDDGVNARVVHVG
jgi:hypothetical protein